MKAQFLTAVLFAAVLMSLACISASLVANPTSVSLSGLHNSQVSLPSIILNNTETAQNVTISSVTASALTYSSYTIGSGNVTGLPTASFNILNQSTYTPSTISIAIPQYQTPGTYTGTLTFAGNYTNGTTLSTSVPISLVVNSTSGISISQSGLSKTANGTLTLTNTGNVPLTSVNLSYSGDFNLAFSPNPVPTAINPGSSYSSVVVSSSNLNSLSNLGSVTSTIYANASSSAGYTTSTTSATFTNSYCSNGSIGNSTRYLEIVSVKDVTSTTDWKWKPADQVTVEVKVKYTNTADSNDELDSVIMLGLYDTQTNSFVDLGSDNELEVDDTLSEGSSSTEQFIIDVPTSDLVSSSNRYKLYAKVYESGDEASLCRGDIGSGSTPSATASDYYKNIEINTNSNEVILKNNDVNTPTTCGGEITITTKAINIGDNNEDKVYVTVYNHELGLNITSDVFSMDTGDSQRLSMTFLIPKNATEKEYDLYLSPYYKYSKSSGYRGYPKDPYTLIVKVENCKIDVKNATISAQFSADTPKAVIGNQVIIQATLKNTGNTATNYTVTVSGNSDWSTVASITPSTFTLNAGESKTVDVALNINSGATTGEKEFSINTDYGTQKVRITLEKGTAADDIMNSIKSNWLIYTIALVILILIIVIIIIVKSIA